MTSLEDAIIHALGGGVTRTKTWIAVHLSASREDVDRAIARLQDEAAVESTRDARWKLTIHGERLCVLQLKAQLARRDVA